MSWSSTLRPGYSRQQSLIKARPGNRVTPMARALGLEERTRGPQIRDHAAELELEDLGVLASALAIALVAVR